MKIQNLNFSPNFCAKHKDTRKADDIVRKTNQEFTMFRPSYALQFYSSFDPKNPQAKENKANFVNNFAKKFYDRIRMPSEELEEFDSGAVPYSSTLKILKKEKMGNCRECAIATLATLYANGYYNSIPVSLNFDYKFIDKRSDEVKLEGSSEIDHALVISDMNNKERKGDIKKCIVLDSWLNYADNVQSANATYASVFGKQINQKLLSLAQENNIDIENTQVRIYPFYTPTSYEKKKSARQIGQWVSESYPSIVKKDK